MSKGKSVKIRSSSGRVGIAQGISVSTKAQRGVRTSKVVAKYRKSESGQIVHGRRQDSYVTIAVRGIHEVGRGSRAAAPARRDLAPDVLHSEPYDWGEGPRPKKIPFGYVPGRGWVMGDG